MEYILYGDIFEQVQLWLTPFDLYNLAQICKKSNKQITIKEIKKSTINEIDRKLYNVFGNDVQEFERVLQNSNAIIIGPFITQCILGEYWHDCDIKIHINTDELHYLFDEKNKMYKFEKFDYVYDKSVHNMKILEYMFSKRYSHYFKYNRGKYGDYEVLYVAFIINQAKVIFSKNDFNAEEYNINKNAYDCKKMFIYKINEIFTKCTNFCLNKDLHIVYRKRGFSFYDRDGIISDDMIFEKMKFRIIQVKPYIERFERLKILTRNKYQYICIDNSIYHDRLHDDDKRDYQKIYKLPCSLNDEYIYSCISHLKSPCLFEQIHPGIEHLHGFISNVTIIFVIDTFDLTNKITAM
jgi:hypothetical protein